MQTREKVVFVNVDLRNIDNLFQGTREPLQPLDLMYAANTFDQQRYETVYVHDALENFGLLKTLQFSVVVMSTTNSYLQWNNHNLSLDGVLTLLERFERLRKHKDFYLVVVGPHSLSHYLLIVNKGADAVIVGEPDVTVAPVVEALLRGESLHGFDNVITPLTINDQPRPIAVANLNTLPTPRWEFCTGKKFDAHNAPASFENGFLYELSRGCPFQCIYCNTIDFRRNFRVKSPQTIDRDLAIMTREFQAKYVYFIDESFGYDDAWFQEVMPVVKKHSLNWGCQGNMKFTNESKLRQMADAGCLSMEFGFETFNPTALRYAHKSNDLNRAHELFSSAIKVGISPLLFMLIGLPGETLDTTLATVDFLESLPEGFRFSIGIPTPYPRTRYYELGVQQGLISPGDTGDMLYNVSGKIGTSLRWRNEDSQRRFVAKFGPNNWGNRSTIAELRTLISESLTEVRE
ncbi:radical SAM protein [Sulfobacillus sp. hq2]|uniref:B12-binding domain-containing radical SAM protein n=1 Tax=Sulfobacillus TaxID=28033 RepID=UPI000CD064E3|nr:radical SAM protein [Sulfobacillus sp. hq2]POB10201.1 hypothetical protein CO251_11135 [Sulfobacillus sp. hq2]